MTNASSKRILCAVGFFASLSVPVVTGFSTLPTPALGVAGRSSLWVPPKHVESVRRKDTSLAFMGSDGGILGVGGPELATILLVGYFVLGPSDLYKLVKEVGKFVQNFRTLGTDLSTTFESNMESQLQLTELRKAQQELTDAFSFRRSINVDDTEAFATTVDTPREAASTVGATATAAAGTGASVASAATTGKKKRIRRRKVKKVVAVEEEPASFGGSGDIPDLDMNAEFDQEAFQAAAATAIDESSTSTTEESTLTAEELDAIDKDFDQYTTTDPNPMSEWYDEAAAATAEADAATAAGATTTATSPQETSRFQQQMAGNWNDSIIANTEQLEPVAKVMELLALLEQEKVDADKRLEEEYQRRAELDTEYYQKQRRLLEDAVTSVQEQANAVTAVDKTL